MYCTWHEVMEREGELKKTVVRWRRCLGGRGGGGGEGEGERGGEEGKRGGGGMV